MALTPEEFYQGKWSSELHRRLKQADIIPGWTPTFRLTRNDGKQWVQYEPRGLPGPKYYLAKPGIVAMDQDHLTAGLYVERGYHPGEATPQQLTNGEVMDQQWQWHALVRLWSTTDGRTRFHECVGELPGAVVNLRHSGEGTLERLGPWDANPGSYARALAAEEAIPPSRWIDLIVGVQFSREAWNRDARGVIGDCRNPIVRAYELHELIKDVS